MGKIEAIANQMRGNWQNWQFGFFLNSLTEIYLILNVIKSIKEKKMLDFLVDALGLVFMNILLAIIFYCYLVDTGIY